MNNAAEKLAALRLIRTSRVGPVTYKQLVSQFGSPSQALAAIPELALRGGSKKISQVHSLAAAERELSALEQAGGQLIVLGQANYPNLLAQSDGAPPVFSLIGHAHLICQENVAIVGARNASPNGLRFAQKLATDLGQTGFIISSGLARGLDTSAHQGALATGTVAVLAGGVNVIYPNENRKLYQEIAEQGALVSEMPWSTEPAARLFARRNRIIAGLSRAVALIEAKLGSGSMLTANAAGDFGRSIFAVPGAPYDPRVSGCNALIRDGATLLRSAADIVFDLQNEVRIEERSPMLPFAQAASAAPDPKTVEQVRQELVKLIGLDPMAVDELIFECQVSPMLVQAALLELELAGKVDRFPGGRVALVASF